MHILSFCKFIQQSSSGFYYLQAFFYTSNKLNIFKTQNIIHYNAKTSWCFCSNELFRKTAHTPSCRSERRDADTYWQNRMLTDALNQEPSILYTKTERFFVQISVLRLKNLNFLHSRRLIDKFHRQLVNFICRSGLIESLAMSSIAKICQNHNNNLQLLSMFGKSSFFPGEKTFPWWESFSGMGICKLTNFYVLEVKF